MRWRVAILAAVLWALPAPAFALPHASKLRPHAFASCSRLVGYARRHFAATRGVAENVPRPLSEPRTPLVAQGAPKAAAPTDGGSTPGGSASFSTTNNQEPGVEEPDIVKTDGSTIFALEGGTLYALSTRPALRLAGSLPLGASGYGAQLLIRGTRLLVISSGGRAVAFAGPVRAVPTNRAGIGPAGSRAARPRRIDSRPYFRPATTTVTEVDAANPAAMRVARVMTVDGAFVDARQNGAAARLVISAAPRAIAVPKLRARAAGWVPARRFHSFITGHRYSRPVAACSAVRRPAQFSGLGTLTILTIDLDRGLYASDSSALMADAQLVYGSQHSLYVATQKWVDPATPPAELPAATETVIDRFDASRPDRTPLAASGAVPGYLLNQFSLSEYHGYLRVASTTKPIWWSASPIPSQSLVTVLADRAGSLVPVGQVSGLGAGQQIYSVRFIGDAGYVVTFRRVDPLYTIDLSSPTAPRVAGQLELEGYSSYLHPIAEGLLLGVGEEVGPAGRLSGTQLELFEVSTPSAPRLQARAGLGAGSNSQVQFDHHAFLFWPATSLAVLPVTIYSALPIPVPLVPRASTANPPAPAPKLEAPQPFQGAVAFRIARSGLTEVARIAHDPVGGGAPPIERSLVVGAQLMTVSSAGVMASSLSTLERQAFVAFPVPPGEGPSPATRGSTSR
jgi:hypothetical protein